MSSMILRNGLFFTQCRESFLCFQHYSLSFYPFVQKRWYFYRCLPLLLLLYSLTLGFPTAGVYVSDFVSFYSLLSSFLDLVSLFCPTRYTSFTRFVCWFFFSLPVLLRPLVTSASFGQLLTSHSSVLPLTCYFP